MRIVNYEDLISHGNVEGRKLLASIMEAGLSAGNPYKNTRQLITLEGDTLTFYHPDMIPQGDPRSGPAVFDLKEIDRIYIFGIGKGIQYIAKAVEDVLGDRITGGLVLGKKGDEIIMTRTEVELGGHPVPDAQSLCGCQRILDIISEAKLTPRDLVISVMGNGCSSLCTLPREGITLQDVIDYTQLCLIDKGIATDEFSYLRNAIDKIRGGRYIKAVYPAQMVTLLGIGPGRRQGDLDGYAQLTYDNFWLPCLPDCTTTEEALAICDKWNVLDLLPASIREALLKNGPQNKTLDREEYETYNARVFGVMPEKLSALAAAMEKAQELGFATHHIAERTLVEAAPIGHFMGQVALNVAHNDQPFCAPCALFVTGELIVAVEGETGVGGTNQEYCLAASLIIDGNERIVMSAVDTDGTDGPGGEFHPEATARGITVLTGGIIDGYTAGEARELGVDIHRAIMRHDSSQALWRLKSGIAAVHDISVGDLHCTLILPREC